MTRKAKHTAYQPEGDKWRCPNCSMDSPNFWIDDAVEDSDDDCNKLHTQDECRCFHCGYRDMGSTVARRLQRLDEIMDCPRCRGKGAVSIKSRDKLIQTVEACAMRIVNGICGGEDAIDDEVNTILKAVGSQLTTEDLIPIPKSKTHS